MQDTNTKHDSSMEQQKSNLVFRLRSMHDYHEDRSAIIDLYQSSEAKNRMPALMSTNSTVPSSGFHCEPTDYLWCMEQYSESYCGLFVDPIEDRIVAACMFNFKQVHYGEHILTAIYIRMLRVEPSRQRQHLGRNLLLQFLQAMKGVAYDCTQEYTRITNIPSLTLQQRIWEPRRKEISLLDIFILPTALDATATPLYKLNQTETERLWTVDLADWVYRPVLSDLRRIMNMKEYKGTFVIGDFPSGRYSAASVWQSTNIILCDDRSHSTNAYRGPYWVAFNFFQSPLSESNSRDEKEILLSSLCSAAFNNGIPFLLCYTEQSSVFNLICRKRALAITTGILSRHDRSERMTVLKNKFDKSPVWLDPRDFCTLPQLSLLPEKTKSHL
jgi:hypothetical protein